MSLKILIVSDSPLCTSAYADQSMGIAKRLIADGHQVLYYGLTHFGKMIQMDGVTVVGAPLTPGARRPMTLDYAKSFDADVVLTVKDPYCLDTNMLRELDAPWIAVCPLDTEPVDLITKSQISYAASVLALTKQAQAMLHEEGTQATYCPHGIETAFWTPGDKSEARQRLGLPADVFIPLFVGINNTVPSRKNIDILLLAWAQFLAVYPEHREAVLYLHTCLRADHGGYPIEDMLDRFEISKSNYRATDQAQYESYNIPREYVRDLYRAADVLISIGNEGFCLPNVEAQACGLPVISIEWAAQRETAMVGWRIKAGETVWHPRGAFWFRPYRHMVVKALQLAYEARNDTTMHEKAHEAAQRYEWDTVWETYWRPMWDELEALIMGANLEVAAQ
jgi:glycosyltransferase involved in cell wall biosynthesis